MRISDWSSDVCSSDLPMTDDELIERMRAIPFIGFEDRGQQGTQDASICHDAADRIKAMSERVAELEGVLQSGLKVIEQELSHLLESCCLIDKETLRSEEHTSELQSLMRISYAV